MILACWPPFSQLSFVYPALRDIQDKKSNMPEFLFCYKYENYIHKIYDKQINGGLDFPFPINSSQRLQEQISPE